MPSNQYFNSPASPKVSAGNILSFPGVDWSKQNRTLILSVSTTCHFCSESGPFYQQLAKHAKSVHLMAVVPQNIEDGRRYLQGLGVPIGDVNQSALSALGVEGTPTLILVDNKGTVIDTWVSKLAASKETEVLSKLE